MHLYGSLPASSSSSYQRSVLSAKALDSTITRISKSEDVIYSYMKKNEDGTVQVIQVNRLHGYIRPQRFDDVEVIRRELPPGAKVIHRTEPWGQYLLDAFVTEYPVANNKIMVMMVQVPIVPQAIQLQVGGLPQKETEHHLLLEKLLSSLKGKSNWDSNPNAITLRVNK